MSNRYFTDACPAVSKVLSVMLLAFAVLLTAGCNEPEDNDGVSISSVPLSSDPPDTALNLNCANVGIYTETCVLDDPENPFANAVIVEFDENNEEAFNKFDLANGIPAGPAGAKSRFYFWATALARRQIGENQYFTALALHELYTAQVQQTGFGDPIVREQALKAYRSLLDNFFSSVVFFACFFDNGVFRGCPPPDGVGPDDVPAAFAVPLNEIVACNLFFRDATAIPSVYPNGFERIELGEELGCTNDQGCFRLATLDLLAGWGYAYQAPANGGVCGEGVVTINDG